MGLIISKNGIVRDFALPAELPLRRVVKSHAKETEFDEVLDGEDSKEKEHQKRRMRQAEQSYQKTEQNTHTSKHIWLAKEAMTRPVHTLDEKSVAIDALDLMNKFHFHHVPVTREGVLVGMVSDRDLLPFSENQLRTMKLEQIGPKEIIAANENTDLKTISAIMLSQGISAIPILSKNSQLLGIITKSDILRLVIKNGPFEIHV